MKCKQSDVAIRHSPYACLICLCRMASFVSSVRNQSLAAMIVDAIQTLNSAAAITAVALASVHATPSQKSRSVRNSAYAMKLAK